VLNTYARGIMACGMRNELMVRVVSSGSVSRALSVSVELSVLKMRCAAMTQLLCDSHTEITHFNSPTMMQVCLNVGGTRYETRLKTLLKGAEQGSEVLAGICQTLTTQHQNYSVSECVRQWLLKHVSFAAA